MANVSTGEPVAEGGAVLPLMGVFGDCIACCVGRTVGVGCLCIILFVSLLIKMHCYSGFLGKIPTKSLGVSLRRRSDSLLESQQHQTQQFANLHL
jgi:hypothetical protein